MGSALGSPSRGMGRGGGNRAGREVPEDVAPGAPRLPGIPIVASRCVGWGMGMRDGEAKGLLAQLGCWNPDRDGGRLLAGGLPVSLGRGVGLGLESAASPPGRPFPTTGLGAAGRLATAHAGRSPVQASFRASEKKEKEEDWADLPNQSWRT